jgi:hypothetical protein
MKFWVIYSRKKWAKAKLLKFCNDLFIYKSI